MIAHQGRCSNAEAGHFFDTRQMVPLPSSVTSSDPSFATATPTGRPHTCFSDTTKPVMKSSYSPVGLPLANGRNTTLYPAPPLLRRHDEAGHEILVLARRLAVGERQEHDFVAGPLSAVPRSVRRHEGAGLVLRADAL